MVASVKRETGNMFIVATPLPPGGRVMSETEERLKKQETSSDSANAVKRPRA
jgi:hypothetical protein